MDRGTTILCGICNEDIKIPFKLPCGHEFCLECMTSQMVSTHGDDTEKEKKCYCPKCSRNVEVPDAEFECCSSNGTKEVSIVHKFDEISADILTGQCSVCEKKDVDIYCIDCDKNYCFQCSSVHSKIPSTMFHAVENMGSNNRVGRSCPESKLDGMSSTREVYCEKCNVIVTLEKFTMQHNQHKMLLIPDYIKWRKLVLDERIASMCSRDAEIDKAQHKMKLELFKGKQIQIEAHKSVDQRAKAIQDHVDKIAREFHQEIDRQVLCYHKKVSAFKTDLDNQKQNLNDEVIKCKNEIQSLDSNPLMPAEVDTADMDMYEKYYVPDACTVSFSPGVREPVLTRDLFGSLKCGATKEVHHAALKIPDFVFDGLKVTAVTSGEQ